MTFFTTVNNSQSKNSVDERLASAGQLLLQGRQGGLVEPESVPVDRPGLRAVVTQEGGVAACRVHTLN